MPSGRDSVEEVLKLVEETCFSFSILSGVFKTSNDFNKGLRREYMLSKFLSVDKYINFFGVTTNLNISNSGCVVCVSHSKAPIDFCLSPFSRGVLKKSEVMDEIASRNFGVVGFDKREVNSKMIQVVGFVLIVEKIDVLLIQETVQ
ncbi:hypothetical protein BB560_000393 [Smittium megazygosporum]|uniref:Uncharacterized protein n=1 Tax=Smittium megazygosporum TaxID=133381 RepID=A0A2T9ZKN4_9FUNG|nr:hypothetical protein BB560_000393 [Smittium megazygosporum]